MTEDPKQSAYAAAGVDIDAQDIALSRVGALARSTFTPGVLTEIGSFGGLFRPDLSALDEPVLVASTDGVGTKLAVAGLAGDYSTVGRDLVNHCVNDILVQGARPLFFLDYVGAGVLEPDRMTELIEGVAAGCRENGCALLGGETAEMPGFYRPGDYELVGTIVGMVDRAAILDGSRVQPDDVLIALPSAGLHTNGYSLARRVCFDILALAVDDPFPGAGTTVGEELLAPHLSYLSAIEPLLGHPGLHALVHVTGGGLTDNVPRVLPRGRSVVIERGWTIPPVFRLIEEHGEVSRDEMFRVFNMGIGLVVIAASETADEIRDRLRSAGVEAFFIGRVETGGHGVAYRDG